MASSPQMKMARYTNKRKHISRKFADKILGELCPKEEILHEFQLLGFCASKRSMETPATRNSTLTKF